jgi:hypothetical protein
MSRCDVKAKIEGNTIAVGLEGPLWFFQLYDDDDGDPCMDVDDISRFPIMQLMREHCDLKDNRTMEVYRQMMMDISPV